MIEEKKVISLANSRLKEIGAFLVDVNISHDNRIRVIIDSENGISVNDCVAVSRNIEHNLDRDIEDFSLEVTSAGLTEPFRHPRQFIKNLGREVKVKLNDGSVMKGILKNADESEIELLVPKKGKKGSGKSREKEQELITIDMEDIKETKLIISFK